MQNGSLFVLIEYMETVVCAQTIESSHLNENKYANISIFHYLALGRNFSFGSLAIPSSLAPSLFLSTDYYSKNRECTAASQQSIRSQSHFFTKKQLKRNWIRLCSLDLWFEMLRFSLSPQFGVAAQGSYTISSLSISNSDAHKTHATISVEFRFNFLLKIVASSGR